MYRLSKCVDYIELRGDSRVRGLRGQGKGEHRVCMNMKISQAELLRELQKSQLLQGLVCASW